MNIRVLCLGKSPVILTRKLCNLFLQSLLCVNLKGEKVRFLLRVHMYITTVYFILILKFNISRNIQAAIFI